MRAGRKPQQKTRKTVGPDTYLAKPYGRLIIPEEDGTFRAEIVEFPGCIALADTAAEALAELEDVAWSWLKSAIDKGRSVPEPMENTEYSGKLVLRLPKSMHKKAAQAAERDGVSLNQFIVSSLAEYVGVRSTLAPVTSAVATANLMGQVYVSAHGLQPAEILEVPAGRVWTSLVSDYLNPDDVRDIIALPTTERVRA